MFKNLPVLEIHMYTRHILLNETPTEAYLPVIFQDYKLKVKLATGQRLILVKS